MQVTRNIFDVRKFKNIFLCFLLIQQNFRAANAMNACFFILLPKGEKCGVAMLSRENRWSSKSHHACMFGRVEKKRCDSSRAAPILFMIKCCQIKLKP